jgi:hypothetical protein
MLAGEEGGAQRVKVGELWTKLMEAEQRAESALRVSGRERGEGSVDARQAWQDLAAAGRQVEMSLSADISKKLEAMQSKALRGRLDALTERYGWLAEDLRHTAEEWATGVQGEGGIGGRAAHSGVAAGSPRISSAWPAGGWYSSPQTCRSPSMEKVAAINRFRQMVKGLQGEQDGSSATAPLSPLGMVATETGVNRGATKTACQLLEATALQSADASTQTEAAAASRSSYFQMQGEHTMLPRI